MYEISLTQSSVDVHLGCFHVLAIVNSAVMNMRVHVSFLKKVLSGYMPKSGISGSYGSFMYRFLRYLQTVLHSGCTIMPFAATWMELENLILSEMSQKDKYHMISLITGI